MSQKQSNIGYVMPYFDTPIGKGNFDRTFLQPIFKEKKLILKYDHY